MESFGKTIDPEGIGTTQRELAWASEVQILKVTEKGQAEYRVCFQKTADPGDIGPAVHSALKAVAQQLTDRLSSEG